jgi:RHS repeat-associated protein
MLDFPFKRRVAGGDHAGWRVALRFGGQIQQKSAGRRIAKVDPYGGTHYFFGDHLGSTRVMTDAAGQVQQEWVYHPFGQATTVVDTLTNPYTRYWIEDRNQFAGMWRDDETGTDHTLYRHYADNLARWLTPDPAGKNAVNLANPQTWNMYTYVLNNPLRYIDPTGLELVPLGQHTDEEIKRRTRQIKQELNNRDLSGEQINRLKAERTTLQLERRGNAAGRAFLAALDSVGARNGLQLSDLTLTTATKGDFASLGLSRDQMARLTNPNTQAFVVNKQNPIYLRTEASAWAEALSSRANEDYYGTVLRHEQVHTRGGLEPRAYSVQREVLQLFRFDFSPERFRSIDDQLQRAIDENE